MLKIIKAPRKKSFWLETAAKISLIGFTLFLFANLCFAASPSTEEIARAYQAIPHKQTTYSASKAGKVKPEDARNLEKFFKIVDEAVVARVNTLKWFYSAGQQGQDFKSYNKEIKEIIEKLKAIDASQELKVSITLVWYALNEQAKFYKEMDNLVSSGKKFPGLKQDGKIHPFVRSSSSKLIKSYKFLKANFPKESAHNQTAFFDHLCALDFI